MPDIIEAIPQTISAAADSTDHEIQFSAEFNPLLGSVQTAFIKIVSGTFKFNVGGANHRNERKFHFCRYHPADTVSKRRGSIVEVSLYLCRIF